MDEYSGKDKENGTREDFKEERSEGWRITVGYFCGEGKNRIGRKMITNVQCRQKSRG